MKKRALLILVLAASLLLCACGKSEAAAAADEQIASIGEVKIESITLSKNAAELKEGESVTLSAVVAPENATESYGWKSADESVATVDENGVVTAVAPGNTNILAMSESGKTAACSVTVAAPTAYEQLNDAERELFDYMTGAMLKSFYNASAVRIRKIYNSASSDTVQAIIVDLEGTNRLGGTTYDLFGIFHVGDTIVALPCGDGEIDLSQPMPGCNGPRKDQRRAGGVLGRRWDARLKPTLPPFRRKAPHGGREAPPVGCLSNRRGICFTLLFCFRPVRSSLPRSRRAFRFP